MHKTDRVAFEVNGAGDISHARVGADVDGVDQREAGENARTSDGDSARLREDLLGCKYGAGGGTLNKSVCDLGHTRRTSPIVPDGKLDH